MNKLKIYIAAVVSTILTAPAALAADSISADIASNYFDANWVLINTNSQSHQPATKVFGDISSRYFDANWALTNNNGMSHSTSTVTHAEHDMILEPGED